MIRQIIPLFFTTDIPGTLAYYENKLGFECLGMWPDANDTDYAIVMRDRQAIHFRCAEPPTANPDKYEDELLDAYINVENADALHAEFAAKGRGVYARTWQCAVGWAGVCGEGLRRTAAGVWDEFVGTGVKKTACIPKILYDPLASLVNFSKDFTMCGAALSGFLPQSSPPCERAM